MISQAFAAVDHAHELLRRHALLVQALAFVRRDADVLRPVLAVRPGIVVAVEIHFDLAHGLTRNWNLLPRLALIDGDQNTGQDEDGHQQRRD